ncbi:MAG TPA: tRNA dihydrouridine synthase DusB [Bacillota bacterium]|nr:tRNA dihydrouridine synthase DusB [Bacillota bacterium]
MSNRGITLGRQKIGPLWLAPMAGVTDKPFRRIAAEQGCDMAFTEMISGKALEFGNPRTWDLLDIKGESPIGVQLFGCSPSVLAAAAKAAQAEGATVIDINMGCPVPKIVGNGEGAALMRQPQLAEAIVSEVSAAVDIPVTVKIRAGWDENSINAPALAVRLAAAGAAAITVHGRTREQMYSGRANWEVIAEVVRAVEIPVIGNGDIWSGKAALAMQQQTGCAGIMVARGAMGNPWLFAEIKAALRGADYQPPTLEQRIAMALRHFQMELAYRGRDRGVLYMRKHLAWYLKGLPHTASLKRSIFAETCPRTIAAMLQAYQKNNR